MKKFTNITMQEGEGKIIQIPLNNGCFLSVNNKEYYELKNIIDIVDDDNNVTKCRISKIGECWIIIPEKLVPKVEIKLEVVKAGEKVNESNNRNCTT